MRYFAALVMLGLGVFLADNVLAQPVNRTSVIGFFEDALARGLTTERLHFRDVEIKPENVMQWLQGPWRILYSCSGRPIDSGSSQKIIFYGEDTFHFIHFPSPTARAEGEHAPTLSKSFPFEIRIHESIPGHIAILEAHLGLAQYRLVEVNESGELVMIDSSEERAIERAGACRPGERYEIIQARIPMS